MSDPNKAKEAVNKVVEHFGKLDILVNGAAGNFLCSVEDLSPNAFQTVVAIDLLGTFNLSSASLEALKQSKGCVINISAMLYRPATMYQAHASAAKAGVDSLTRSMALEWGHHGIRVVGVAPGPIAATEGMSRLSAGVGDSTIGDLLPAGRMGTIQDVAYTSLFLASPVASFITGDVIIVDGGQFLVRPTMITPEMYSALSASRKGGSQKAKL